MGREGPPPFPGKENPCLRVGLIYVCDLNVYKKKKGGNLWSFQGRLEVKGKK